MKDNLMHEISFYVTLILTTFVMRLRSGMHNFRYSDQHLFFDTSSFFNSVHLTFNFLNFEVQDFYVQKFYGQNFSK